MKLAKMAALMPAIAGGVLMSGEVIANQANACDRTCLNTMMDRFVAAVTAKDPTRAPLWVGFRETVNSVVTPAGEGVWQTVTAFDPNDRRYFDPESGNAALLGVLSEGDARDIVSLRIRVQENSISEAEWFVARRNDDSPQGVPGELEMFDPTNMVSHLPATRVIPKQERVSRDALVAIANSYFDGISSKNRHAVIAHPGCIRNENGLKVTGLPLDPQDAGEGVNGLTDCMAGYHHFDIALVQERRFPVVDEEQQVALGSGVFIREAGAPKRRLHFTEYFYIDHAKLRQIEAAMFYANPFLPVPNWPPYDGNFPLPVPQYLPR